MKKDSIMEEPNSITVDSNDENMEEILASIREIISSDEGVSTPPAPSLKSPPLNTLEERSSKPEPSHASRKSEDVLVLTKKSSGLKTETSFSKKEGKSPLESLVSSSLTPLIQTWLEKNLSTLVERIVKEEIKTLLSPQKIKK
jgi:cell pole-organizing protein PopZ